MFMTPKQVDAIAAYFSNTAVIAVYLFGSYARGDADERSDVDLLVETDCASRAWLDVALARRELSERLGLPVDLFEQHKIRKYARAGVWHDRLLIYERPSRQH